MLALKMVEINFEKSEKDTIYHCSENSEIKSSEFK